MSTEITILNYEEYALDYIEGNLNEELKRSFDSFLALNPDVAEEIDEMRDVQPLDSDRTLQSDFKDSLKIDIKSAGRVTSENYEEIFALSVDEELASEVKSDLDNFLEQNPRIERDYNAYKRSILRPNTSIGYPGKSELKQSVPLWDSAGPIFMRVAAVLVIALGSLSIWNAVQNEVYIPRNESLEFGLMDDFIPENEHSPSSTTLEKVTITSPEHDGITKPVKVERAMLESVSKMQSLAIDLEISDQSTRIESRELIAYSPSVPHGLETQKSLHDPQPELSLAQFVGKRFLGVEPKKAPTTGALLREGAIKAIDSRENMSLSASEPSEEKKTIQFLAGNFEFKRVSYK